MKHPRAYNDLEIARYVLGLDVPEQSRNVQKRLAKDDAAAARALKWEAYFLDIVDALPPAPVPETLLSRIEGTLGMLDQPITGEKRTDQQYTDIAEPAAGSAGRRKAKGRINTRRLTLAASAGIAVCAALILAWALLRPIPVEIIQEPVTIQAD